MRGTVGEHTPALVEGFVAAQAATDPPTWAALVRRPPALVGDAARRRARRDGGVGRAARRGLPQTALLRQLPRLTRLGMLPDLGGRDRRGRRAARRPGPAARGAGAPRSTCWWRSGRTPPAGRARRRDVDADRGRSSTRSTPRSTRRSARSSRRASGRCSRSTCRGRWACRSPGCRSPPVRRRRRSRWCSCATEPSATAVGFTTADGRDWHDTALTAARDLAAPAARRRAAAWSTRCRCRRHRLRAADGVRDARQGLEVDTFVVYTDNETWAGTIHPHQALARVPARVGNRREARRGRHDRHRVQHRRPDRRRACSTSSGSTRLPRA